MKYIAVSIFDRQLNAFGRPIFVQAVGVAVREFGDEVNRVESPMNRHPEDFVLHEIGVWDDEDGSWIATEPPRRLIGAVDVKK